MRQEAVHAKGSIESVEAYFSSEDLGKVGYWFLAIDWAVWRWVIPLQKVRQYGSERGKV